ncbi:MAG: hypothetical protein ABI822_22075 [Bryobacteraceae bacterium]
MGKETADRGSAEWGNSTFPRLNDIATQLAKDDIKKLLIALDNSLKKRKSEPVAAKAEFDANFKLLRQHFSTLKDLTSPATFQTLPAGIR